MPELRLRQKVFRMLYAKQFNKLINDGFELQFCNKSENFCYRQRNNIEKMNGEYMIDFNIIEKNYTEHNRKRVEEQYFLGSICGIWDKNGKLFGKSQGFSDFERTKEIKQNSMFRLASMTKPITGCAFMQLCEKGMIDLDTPISRFIPEFADVQVSTKTENGKIQQTEKIKYAITPRMILSHSSGIGSGNTLLIQSKYISKCKSLEETVKKYATGVLEFQPGTCQAYSGTWAFDVLARIIEIISGMQYDKYIKENIFDPLGMFDTTYMPSDEQCARTVSFCKRTDHGIEMQSMPAKAGFWCVGEGWIGGGAGLFSTLDDYSKFARMLLNDGEFNGYCILQKNTVALMSKNQTVQPSKGIKKETMWGLSMRVCREGDVLPKGTFGWSGAYGTHFWVDKENGITCVYMVNLANAGGSGEQASHEFEHDVMSGVKKYL